MFVAGCDFSLGGIPITPVCPLEDFRGAREDTLDALPRWSYDSIRATVPLRTLRNNPGWQGSYVLSLRILAWYDARNPSGSLRSNALLWVELGPEARTTGWALLHAPAADHFQYWGEAHVLGTYGKAPDNEIIYGALSRDADWRFKPNEAWPFVAGRVRERTWFQLAGERPLLGFDVEHGLGCS